ncbi:MAG: hypothetical protein PHP17_02780, partial [Candidatus Omnitrophica bacterium]|nr:hypothetical protein [Candidatus Omnitrophota bacterium]
MRKGVGAYLILAAFIFLPVFFCQGKENLYPARYWKETGSKNLQCQLCPRRCTLSPGQRGLCTVRINKD